MYTLNGNVKSGGASGGTDMVASFGFPLAFWQPSLTCSLDNPLILLAERWVVGKSPSFLGQLLHRVSWSQLEELRNRGRPPGALPAPGVRRGEIDVGEPERLPSRNRLEAPVDRLRVARQVRVRVAEDEIPDIQLRIARTETYRLLDGRQCLRCPTNPN